MSCPVILGLGHNEVIRDGYCRDRRDQISQETTEWNIITLNVQSCDTYRDDTYAENDETAGDSLLGHYLDGDRQRRGRNVGTVFTGSPVLQEEHQTSQSYHA